MRLVPSGTWHVGFEPTQVRVTFTGATAEGLSCYLVDSAAATLNSTTTLWTGFDIDSDLVAGEDISYFQFYAGDSFTVTKIEFYGDDVTTTEWTTTMGKTIQFRRGVVSNLPNLAAGEPGWATDTSALYVGDGVGAPVKISTSISDLGLDADLATFALPADTTISAFGKTIVDDANAAAVLATLSLDADIATLALPANTTISAFAKTLLDDTSATAAKATLEVSEPVGYYISNYANLAAALTAIGATATTLIIDEATTLTANADIPATLGIEVRKGGSFALATYSLTFTGPLTAGNYAIFSGTGSVVFTLTTPVVNQAWFGTTDAALQLAMGSVVAGHEWYLPPGSYTQTSKITIPDGVKFYGGGGDGLETVINSAVSSDVAILVTSISAPERKFSISNFKLLGDAATDAASTGTGGIKIVGSHYGLIENVWVEGFCHGGYATAGTWAGGDTYAGIELSGTVGVNLRRCYVRRCDAGFYLQHGAASLLTATSMRDCTAILNRTYGAYLHNVLTVNWDGGTVESNNGLTTININQTTAGYGISLRNLHFESNQRISGAAASGSSEISADLNGYGMKLDNIHFGAGTTYPEIPLILADSTGSTMDTCFFSTGASATYSYHVQADGHLNLFLNCYIPIAGNDEGADTTIYPVAA